jgi:hypothetical protein
MERRWKATVAPADRARFPAHSIACAEKSTASTVDQERARLGAICEERAPPVAAAVLQKGVERAQGVVVVHAGRL